MDFPTINPVMTGTKIKTTVTKKGYSAVTIAEVLGLADKSTVYKWFRGETLPDITNIVALSVVLEVRMDDLIAVGE